jgi:cytochrome P450
MKIHIWRSSRAPESPGDEAPARRLPKLRESSLTYLRTFGRDPLSAPGTYFDRLGETFELSLLGTRFVLSRDPTWFDEVLVKQAKAFDKDRTTKNLGTLMGQGLLVNDGPKWRERRRLLSPPFLPREVRTHLGAFARAARQELASWRPGLVIDLHAAMARLTMKVALGSLFGYESTQGEHFETHMAAAMRYFEGIAGTQVPLPTWIPTGTNRAFVHARTELRALAARLIDRPAGDGTALATLQAEWAEGKLTRKDVQDEVMTLLVAGHETSALSLTYLLAELGLVQELQEPIASEALAFDDPPTLSDVTRRGALQRAVLEGLRLYPVAWAVGREATQDVHVDDQLIERGTQVYLFQWSMQRSSRYFDRPLQFWPERFADSPPPNLGKGAFAPFGLGPRICVGQQFALAQISVTLSEVLRAYRVETVSPYPPRLRASITARPRDPVLIRVRPRRPC